MIQKKNIYEKFASRPKVYYIWKSGNSISGRFSPYWNNLENRIKNNKLNIEMCSVDESKQPDLTRYEKNKQSYTDIPLIRLISSKGNRYDYNIVNEYRYYYGPFVDPGTIASNKIYKMIVEKQNQ